MAIRISAIVPSYNHEHYVGKAVASVLAQRVEGLELIAIDDASTDGTRAILESFRGDPRVRLEAHARNRGISSTFNRGLELARGEFVAYLGSDDYWLPGHLAGAIRLLEDRDAALVYGRARVVDQLDRDVTSRFPFFGSCEEGRAFEALMTRSNFIPFVSVVMRREAALAAGGFDESLVTLQDYDLWIRLAAHRAIRYRNETTVAFRWDGRNTSTPTPQNSIRFRRELIHVLEKALREMPEPLAHRGLTRPVRSRLADTYARLGRRIGDPCERARCYRRALHHDPLRFKLARRYLVAKLAARWAAP